MPRGAIRSVLAVVAMVTIAAACSSGTTSAVSTPPSAATSASSATSASAATSASSATGVPAGCVGPLDGPTSARYRGDVGAETADLLSLDVYRREGAVGCPVLIWMHGGGWRSGDKAGKAIDTKVAFAGEMGAVLVSVNYRLVTEGGDVRWPVMGQDAAASVGWVIEHAGELGVDPERVALIGHSAGAHLVAILATNPTLLEEAGASREDVGCAVMLDSAAYDITPADARRIPLLAAAFGDDPATLADASPTVQARAHPTGMPDVLVVTRGTRQRVAEAGALAAAVRAGGATGQLLAADGYTHEQVNTELGAPGERTITPPVRGFLRTCWS